MKKNKNNRLKTEKMNDYRSVSMYHSLKINNFRIFDEIELTGFSRVNLFFGPNNSGKTSILEAFFTHAAGLNFGPFRDQVILKRQSGISGYLDYGEKIVSLFKRKNIPPFKFSISAKMMNDDSQHILNVAFKPSHEISDLDPVLLGQHSKISPSEELIDISETINPLQIRTPLIQIPNIYIGEWNTTFDNLSRKIEIKFPKTDLISEQPFKAAYGHDILSHRVSESDIRVFSYLKRYEMIGEFTYEMQRVFPEVNEIDMIPYPDGRSGAIYVKVSDGRKIPLHVFGDGMRRWFHILGHMIVQRNGVHCIEEIDSTFHPGAYSKLSQLLIRYSQQFNNQLFLTSHSIEFTDAFLNALYGTKGSVNLETEDPVRIYTIKHDSNENTEIWSMPGRDAFEKRQKYELELRG